MRARTGGFAQGWERVWGGEGSGVECRSGKVSREEVQIGTGTVQEELKGSEEVFVERVHYAAQRWRRKLRVQGRGASPPELKPQCRRSAFEDATSSPHISQPP